MLLFNAPIIGHLPAADIIVAKFGGAAAERAPKLIVKRAAEMFARIPPFNTQEAAALPAAGLEGSIAGGIDVAAGESGIVAGKQTLAATSLVRVPEPVRLPPRGNCSRRGR